MGREKVTENCTAIDWHMPIGTQHFAISVAQNSMTSSLIDTSQVFAVNFVNVAFMEKIIQIGSVSGKTHDKFAEFEITKEETGGIDCCYLKKAVAYIACHVVKRIEISNYVLYVGKVLYSQEIQFNAKRLFHIKENIFTTTKDV